MHNLHVYNYEKQVIFNEDFARLNFADTGIQTHNLLTHAFFTAARTFHTHF